jgi:hypothetical protein
MGDDYLRRIVASAAQDRPMPTLRVVAGNTLFVGTPGPASKFGERAQYALAEEEFLASRVRKKAREEEWRDAYARAGEMAGHLERAVRDGDAGEDVLTLHDCQVWPASGGDGVKVAQIRIPIEAVDGWWVGAGQRLAVSEQGGGWLAGFGFMVPVDAE